MVETAALVSVTLHKYYISFSFEAQVPMLKVSQQLG